MRLLFGELQKRVFYYEFISINTSEKVKISKNTVSKSRKKDFRNKCPYMVWILLSSTKNIIEVLGGIRNLDSKYFSELLPSIILQIQFYQDNKIEETIFTEMLIDLLQDNRLQTQDILDITAIPSVRRIIVNLGSSLSFQTRKEIAKSYRIDSQWLSVEKAIPNDLFQLTKFLLSEKEAIYLKNKRENILSKIKEEKESKEKAIELNKKRLRIQEEQLRQIIGERGILEIPDDIEITDEYLEAIKLIKSKSKVIFITGDPGTGKSTLIQLLKIILKDNVAVLSFTGSAALNIGGQTINSFFHMPLHILPLDWINDSSSFRNKAQALNRIIIDEVSMLRPDMLDAISSSLSYARKDPRPFGGIQLILFGDLYQLPPIIQNDKAINEYYTKTYQKNRFFFASKVLQKCKLEVITLKKMFRTNQPEYLKFLSKIRNASADLDDIDNFNMIIEQYPEFSNSDSFIHVTPFRDSANRINRIKLENLEGNTSSFEANVIGEKLLKLSTEKLKSLFPGDLVLNLKPKAQIMFIKNDSGKRWVNGDLGIIEEINENALKITTRSGLYIVNKTFWSVNRYKIDSLTNKLGEEEIGQILQFPVRLAWAITIHKVQGQTFDKLLIDFTGGVFDSGMAYVALSRCRTMEGLRLTRNLVPADIIVDKTVVEFMNSLLNKNSSR